MTSTLRPSPSAQIFTNLKIQATRSPRSKTDLKMLAWRGDPKTCGSLENGQRTLWNSIRVTRSARPVVNVLRGGAEGEFTGIDLAEKHRSRSLAGGDTA